MSILSSILGAIFGVFGNGITKANELYTSRVNTANATRGQNALLRNLPVVIICAILLILIIIPKKTN